MIDDSLYNKIIDVLPILCVDGFIVDDDKILLLKRNNYPAINEWWVPGGRVVKNELLCDSIIRKVKEETGLDVEILNQIGITETIFETKHTVNVCFSLRVKSDNINITINSEHSEYKWFKMDSLPININSELYKIIKIMNYEI